VSWPAGLLLKAFANLAWCCRVQNNEHRRIQYCLERAWPTGIDGSDQVGHGPVRIGARSHPLYRWGTGAVVPSHEAIHLLDAQLRNAKGHVNPRDVSVVPVLGGFPGGGAKALQAPTSDERCWASWSRPTCTQQQAYSTDSAEYIAEYVHVPTARAMPRKLCICGRKTVSPLRSSTCEGPCQLQDTCKLGMRFHQSAVKEEHKHQT